MAVELVHQKIKEARNEQDIRERNTIAHINAYIVGILREIGEQIPEKDEIVFKRYPNLTLVLTKDGPVCKYKNKPPILDNYESFVKALEADEMQIEKKKRWEGMTDLDIADDVLNSVNLVVQDHRFKITGKYFPYTQNATVEYIMKELNIERDEAKRVVSSTFNYFDQITKDEKLKPLSEEEKTKFTMGIIKAAEHVGKAIAKELDK